MNYRVCYTNELAHHGIKGQRWGIRNYQDYDGHYTAAGRARYGIGNGRPNNKPIKFSKRDKEAFALQKTESGEDGRILTLREDRNSAKRVNNITNKIYDRLSDDEKQRYSYAAEGRKLAGLKMRSVFESEILRAYDKIKDKDKSSLTKDEKDVEYCKFLLDSVDLYNYQRIEKALKMRDNTCLSSSKYYLESVKEYQDAVDNANAVRTEVAMKVTKDALGEIYNDPIPEITGRKIPERFLDKTIGDMVSDSIDTKLLIKYHNPYERR